MEHSAQRGAAPAQTQQQTPPPSSLAPEPKRHAACDECRTRKLKCSGHRPACDRCARESLLPCVYSLQKQMGRPRKRRRAGGEEEDDVEAGFSNDAAALVSGESGNGAVVISPPYSLHGGNWSGGEGGMGQDGMEGLGYSGFEGFEFRDAGVNGAGLNGVDVFELDPSFSLDPLLAGALIGAMERSGDGDGGVVAPHQAHSTGSTSSHDTQPATHDQSISQHPLLSRPAGLPCACLSNIYLTLSSLHSLSSHDFPFILPSLRAALATATAVLNCPHCPLSFATASQNIHLLISLLMTLIDSIHKLLTTIDAEAQRVEAAGIKKPFVLADASAPAHMHSGTHDCPVRFGMDLTGSEWRELARKVVKGQIIGDAAEAEAGGAEGTVYGTLAAFVRRQNKWHDDPAMCEIRKSAIGGGIEGMGELGRIRLCVQNVEHVTSRMKLLDI